MAWWMTEYPEQSEWVQRRLYLTKIGSVLAGMVFPHGGCNGSNVSGVSGIVRAKPTEVRARRAACVPNEGKKLSHLAQVGTGILQGGNLRLLAPGVDLPEPHRACSVPLVPEGVGCPAALLVDDGLKEPGIEIVFFGFFKNPNGVRLRVCGYPWVGLANSQG